MQVTEIPAIEALVFWQGLEPGTISQQTSVLTVRSFNARVDNDKCGQ